MTPTGRAAFEGGHLQPLSRGTGENVFRIGVTEEGRTTGFPVSFPFWYGAEEDSVSNSKRGGTGE